MYIYIYIYIYILRGPWHSRYCGEATDGPCGVRIPAGTEDFFVFQNAQACCGAHPAPRSVRIWVYSRGVKLPEHDVTTDHHLAPSLRMSGSIPLLPPYVFMAWTERTCLLGWLIWWIAFLFPSTVLNLRWRLNGFMWLVGLYAPRSFWSNRFRWDFWREELLASAWGC